MLIHLHFGALSCGRHTSPKFLPNFDGLAAAQTEFELRTLQTELSQLSTDLKNFNKDFVLCQLSILRGSNILLLANCCRKPTPRWLQLKIGVCRSNVYVRVFHFFRTGDEQAHDRPRFVESGH